MPAEKKALRVDVISDSVCPWCYVGKRNLDEAIARVADRYEVEVAWHPFQLSPEVPAEGRDWEEYVTERFGSMEALNGMRDRIAEVGKTIGIPFAFERITRAVNTFDAHRLILLAGAVGKQDEVVEALFRGNFVDGGDIGNRDTLVRIAADAGMDEEQVREALASDVAADGVRQGLAEARRIGVQGVPFFIVNGRLAVSGAQPPEALVGLFDRASSGEE